MKRVIAVALLLGWLGISSRAQPAPAERAGNARILGMYVHQHWPYNHPYAARTWTIEDWRGYLDGLSRLGFNMVLIWPVLETMPEPLTSSDEANLAKIAAVIDIAHREFAMRAFVVLCPNVSVKNDEARKHTFEARPFFKTDDRVDPADPVAFGKLMAWREKLLRPLAQTDGLFIIDSDPGGFPHSTNLEFAYILTAHRRMLDRLRPGIEVVYWAHFGWESYGRFYETGVLKRGAVEEPREAIALLARQRLEPWSVASSGFPPNLADGIGQGDRVLGFPYGAIEREPSFPFTLFGGDAAYQGGQQGGPRGVLGNSQTHCIQLPNTFAFSRGARGLSAGHDDYVNFANDLVSGRGEAVVEGWAALQTTDVGRIRSAADKLAALAEVKLEGGALKGLLLGSPARFVDDLVLQLRATGALHEFRAAINASPHDNRLVRGRFAAFVGAIEAWQHQHGYGGHWRWPAMQEALRKLDSAPLNAVLDTLTIVSEEGASPFERVKNGLARLETYTPRLITAMKQALAEMETKP